MYGSLASVSLPQGSLLHCGYNVVYHYQYMNMWMTDCSVKRFVVLGLDKVLYKCRTFTIYFHLGKMYNILSVQLHTKIHYCFPFNLQCMRNPEGLLVRPPLTWWLR
ncbi:hypothetical protein GOODEAATRI_029832 [Goodea atripinnis]|uniref:Uncharacterized protein n=1 Tax=Goodea atripinnis TaxID=208336 RepID=A0ABV0NSM4_9TELE